MYQLMTVIITQIFIILIYFKLIDLKQVFDNKYKFKKKIFLNKIAPSFGAKLNLNKLKQQQQLQQLKIKNTNSNSMENLPTSTTKVNPLPPEYYQKLYGNNIGYTMATKDNHLDIN